MQTRQIARCGLLAMLLACLAGSGWAQVRAPNDSNVHYGGILKQHPKADTPAPTVAAPPTAWPRLDPGAVICTSHADLERRAALMRGEQAGPADCRLVGRPTAITILNRAGPGATEIQVTGGSETGWTDAWLPATAPSGSTASR